MKGRPLLALRVLSLLFSILSLLLLSSRPAFADVYGRLHFSVKNAADEKPIAGAKVTLHDTASVHPDTALTTDAEGSVTSVPLEIRPWSVVTEVENFESDTRQVTVVADAVTEVEVLLEPLKEKVIKITGTRELVKKNEPANVKSRNQTFIQKFPVNAGNPQNLGQVLRSNPGFVQDSVNQVHPRGEHSATSIYINGFALPGVLQGRAGQILSPEVIQNLNILTGGYPPEYGGELAAVLNVNLRSGTLAPYRSLEVQGGGYKTLFGSLTLGGQAGGSSGGGETTGQSQQGHRFGYFVNLSGRSTDNALEPPQPDDQTAHNHGQSQTYFGNFDYNIGPNDLLTLTLNAAPANTQVANRTGLPARFAAEGQGFGYAGHLSAADASAAGIASQQLAGQDDYQEDRNNFGNLNFRHSFSDRLTGLFSVGLTNSDLNVRNRNPAVNLLALPADNSIEFNPTILRHARNTEFQGSLTYAQGTHTFKVGLLSDEQSGRESYNLIPASQLALDALAATDPRLAPSGTPQVDENGAPLLDELGNQVFLLDPNYATVPTVRVNKSGFYRSAYLQDTWNVTRRFTANYGLRTDWYKQRQLLAGTADTVDTVRLSPRVNLAYLLAPRTVARASYNRLFTQPPLSQGSQLGVALPPQLVNMYETSVERQIATNQTVKLSFYYKDFKNLLDTGLLLDGTQIGAYVTDLIPKVLARGVELSYDLLPRNNVGWGSYLSWANLINKPLNGFSDPYTDHDQLNTIGAGLDYTFKNQAVVGLNLYYGSGTFSSVVGEGGKRTPRTQVNLRLATSPHLFGSADHGGGLQLDVENLFDQRNVINFQSAFSGTRFQQGRRVLLSANGKF